MPRPQRFDFMLQNGLNNWVKDSRQLSAALVKPNLFLRYREGDIIEVKLDQLTDDYLRRHVAPDPAKYCDSMLLSLEQAMFRTLSFIGIEDYSFAFIFLFNQQVIKRRVGYYFLCRSRVITE